MYWILLFNYFILIGSCVLSNFFFIFLMLLNITFSYSFNYFKCMYLLYFDAFMIEFTYLFFFTDLCVILNHKSNLYLFSVIICFLTFIILILYYYLIVHWIKYSLILIISLPFNSFITSSLNLCPFLYYQLYSLHWLLYIY